MSTKTGRNGDSPAIRPVSLDISVGQDMYLPEFFGHMARFLWTNHCHERRFARNFWTYQIEPLIFMSRLHYVQKKGKRLWFADHFNVQSKGTA